MKLSKSINNKKCPFWHRKLTLKVRILHILTTFTQVTKRLKKRSSPTLTSVCHNNLHYLKVAFSIVVCIITKWITWIKSSRTWWTWDTPSHSLICRNGLFCNPYNVPMNLLLIRFLTCLFTEAITTLFHQCQTKELAPKFHCTEVQYQN